MIERNNPAPVLGETISGDDDTIITQSPTGLTASTTSRPLARFYMTSDLRAATGLTRTHLDFYLREGIIVPTARTESGYLLFDETELTRLRQVIIWRQDGVAIRDIRTRLARAQDDDPRAMSATSTPS